MKSLKYIAAAAIILLASCDLDETPKSQVSKDPVFTSTNGLELYSHSFYDTFRGAGGVTFWNTSDVFINAGTHQGGNTFYKNATSYTPQMEGSWDWTRLRNINYFIVNNVSPQISASVRNNYNGIARFFRAWFYYDKMTEFGDVPWINRPLDINDEELTAPRDPRTLIADSIYADLEFAVNNITTTKDATSTTITKLVAAAFESRFCLWEGTYRKYCKSAGLQSTANTWLERAQKAAEVVINSGQYDVYTADGARSFRDLFVATTPVNTETMLAVVYDRTQGITHCESRIFNTNTIGDDYSPIRQVVNLFLKKDGTPWTDTPGYATTPFNEEWKDRDARAGYTFRVPGTTRISNGQTIEVAPDYGCARTGYQGLKFALDDEYFDGNDVCDNNNIYFRYAEVLLNWAEAKAELGTLTDADWAKSIGALRARGGITGGLTSKPTKVDTYLQKTFFPDITDPTILEIRRERITEMMWEDGMDFHTCQRWQCGKLIELPAEGIYIPQLNTLLDMNNDGTPDVYFYTGDEPANKVSGVYYRHVQTYEECNGNYTIDSAIGQDGHTLYYHLDLDRYQWDDRMYFHPISQSDITLNPNLTQNPGY